MFWPSLEKRRGMLKPAEKCGSCQHFTDFKLARLLVEQTLMRVQMIRGARQPARPDWVGPGWTRESAVLPGSRGMPVLRCASPGHTAARPPESRGQCTLRFSENTASALRVMMLGFFLLLILDNHRFIYHCKK